MNRLTSKVRSSLLTILGVASIALPQTGCLSTYGNQVARDLAYVGLQQAVVSEMRNEFEGPRGTNVYVRGNTNNAYETQSRAQQIFETIGAPICIYVGNIDEEERWDKWRYYDRNGNEYEALVTHSNKDNVFSLEESKEFFIPCYEYVSANGLKTIPKNTTIIPYFNPNFTR